MSDREERVERRLTAILAADVVGYSRLMSTHEQGTLAGLKASRCYCVILSRRHISTRGRKWNPR